MTNETGLYPFKDGNYYFIWYGDGETNIKFSIRVYSIHHIVHTAKNNSLKSSYLHYLKLTV